MNLEKGDVVRVRLPSEMRGSDLFSTYNGAVGLVTDVYPDAVGVEFVMYDNYRFPLAYIQKLDLNGNHETHSN